MTPPETPDAVAAALVARLTATEQTVATCESLTAGLAAATIAGVPGSSAVLRGGLITYATDLKHGLAGVDQHVLDEVGPVAEETAAQMAAGARQACTADWGLSLTGVAGPDPQDGHPVGEVFLGIADPAGRVSTTRVQPAGQSRYTLDPAGGEPIAVLFGDRSRIRRESVEFALRELLWHVVEQNVRTNR